MSSDVKRRLDKVERALGVAEPDSPWCQCETDGRSVYVTWGDTAEPVADPVTGEIPEPEPELCPKCGKPIRVVTVTWDEVPSMERTP